MLPTGLILSVSSNMLGTRDRKGGERGGGVGMFGHTYVPWYAWRIMRWASQTQQLG